MQLTDRNYESEMSTKKKRKQGRKKKENIEIYGGDALRQFYTLVEVIFLPSHL